MLKFGTTLSLGLLRSWVVVSVIVLLCNKQHRGGGGILEGGEVDEVKTK